MTHDPLISFTRSLVRCPSRFGEEEAVVSLILAQMTELGFDRVWRDANGSAIGIIEGKLPGSTILLDGHCDTVGIAPGVTWAHDPFGGDVESGFIYGRGTADMKGALAAMIYAAAGLDCTRLRGRVVVSATVMEENLEGAALKTVMDAVSPDFVVIGEATDLMLNRGGSGPGGDPPRDDRAAGALLDAAPWAQCRPRHAARRRSGRAIADAKRFIPGLGDHGADGYHFRSVSGIFGHPQPVPA